MADPRTAGILQDSLEILLRNRPQNREVRNPSLSAQVSGNFTEFRQIGRNFPESRPIAEAPAGRGVREPPTFSGFAVDIYLFLRNRTISIPTVRFLSLGWGRGKREGDGGTYRLLG